MKIIIFLLFSVALFAQCSLEEIKRSDQHYLNASKASSYTKQLTELNDALKLCYSPEIETTKHLMQAQHTQNINEKIAFYNQALISISHFQNKTILLQEQNKIHAILAILYQEQNQTGLAQSIQSKIVATHKNPKPKSHLWVYSLFGFFILWTVINFVRARE